MADCLIVGFNDLDFAGHEERVRRMGTASGAYRDLALSFVRHQGRPLRALDVINHFHPGGRHLHNADFLWPVILVLGSSLHRRGHSFDYVNLPHLQRERFRSKLAAPDLSLVALTTTLYTEPQPLTELVAFVRAHRPEVPIVIGGPYIAGQAKSLGPDAFADQLRYLGADYYVISAEGEGALGDLVSALKSNGPLDGIDNLAFPKDGRMVLTQRSVEYNALAENLVDYGLFSREEFSQFVTTRTAKSCPFQCAFCGFPERAGEYTYLGVENVERELDGIASIGGVTTLTIIDDTFNVPKKRFKDLLRMMIAKRYGFRWNSFFRCDHADEETFDLMAEAGCEGVILGIESGSDRMLGLMNKTVKRADYLRAIPRLESLGIACYASLIVGFPGETEDTVEETIDLIETTGPSYFRAQLWYCDPITPIYRSRDAHGLRGEGFQWSHRTMDVAEACDHIDRMFLTVGNSIWQPQAGFEFWSTFYLQRLGMSRERVRAFLRSFNAAVKEKLLWPEGARELLPARVRELSAVSRIGGGPESGVAVGPTGAEYRETEAWCRRAVSALAADGPRPVNGGAPLDLEQRVSAEGAGRDEVLAAVAAVLAGLRGRRHVFFLAPDDVQTMLLPVVLEADLERDLAEMAAKAAAARSDAERHRRLALPILRRGLRCPSLGRVQPRFDGALVEGNASLEQTMAEYPSLRDEIDLIVEREPDGALRLRTRLSAAQASEMARSLRSILQDRRGAPIKQLTAAAAEPSFDFL